MLQQEAVVALEHLHLHLLGNLVLLLHIVDGLRQHSGIDLDLTILGLCHERHEALGQALSRLRQKGDRRRPRPSRSRSVTKASIRNHQHGVAVHVVLRVAQEFPVQRRILFLERLDPIGTGLRVLRNLRRLDKVLLDEFTQRVGRSRSRSRRCGRGRRILFSRSRPRTLIGRGGGHRGSHGRTALSQGCCTDGRPIGCWRIVALLARQLGDFRLQLIIRHVLDSRGQRNRAIHALVVRILKLLEQRCALRGNATAVPGSSLPHARSGNKHSGGSSGRGRLHAQPLCNPADGGTCKLAQVLG